MLKKLKLEHIIIIGLLIVILLMRTCSPKPCPPPSTKIEVKWDTIEYTTPHYIPKILKKTETKTDSFYKNVDTFAILRDYYANYFYMDTLDNDSIKIFINDIVSENKIQDRVVKYNYRQKTTIITNERYKDTFLNKRKLYYGFGIGGQSTGFNYFGAELLYANKKNQAYGLSFGINNNFSPVIKTTFLWKVGN